MEEYLALATGIAREAGVIMKGYFKLGIEHTFKPDQSPLTEADQKIQQLVIDRVSAAYPEHSLYGEEGAEMKESACVWVFDPIDGTAAFMRGIPTNVFAIALVKDGIPVLGVVYDPYMDRLYHAVRGGGAFMNGLPISTASRTELAGSYVEIDHFRGFKNLNVLERARESSVRFLSYSSTLYAQMLVATGQLDGIIFPGTHSWDSAAGVIIVEEAGGVTSDLHGASQRYDTETKGLVCSGNPDFHAKLVALIAESI